MNGIAIAIFLSVIIGFSSWYLIVLHSKNRNGALALKIISTLLSLGAAIYLSCVVGNQVAGYTLFVILGLILGLVGDIIIFFPTEKHFLFGMGAFFLGHIFYIVALTYRCSPGWDVLIPLLIIGIIVTFAMILLKFEMGNMTPFVIIYGLMIAVMYSFAFIAVYRDSLNLVLFIGTTLFVLSDFVLAWGKFGKGIKLPKWLDIFGGISYFVGQGLIALSIQFFR